MSEVYVSQHPLILHKLTQLRSVKTYPRLFRSLVYEITLLLAYEATQDISLAKAQVETPMGMADGHDMVGEIGLVPILRAGLGMVDGFMELLPDVQVWHIGLYRDEETLTPVEYYNKLPSEPTVQTCFVLDPMLATGGSAEATINIIKQWGVKKTKYIGLLAAPEGIAHLQKTHPDVPVHVAQIDDHLNDIGFIVPGLGDAGDRQFGT